MENKAGGGWKREQRQERPQRLQIAIPIRILSIWRRTVTLGKETGALGPVDVVGK